MADPAEGADRRICVIGMGYVGLPLAIDLVTAGFDVLAVDRSASVIERLRSGRSHVEDVPPSSLSEASATGRLRFETTDRPWGDATVAFICVPTPVTASREPDLTPIRSAANYVGQSLNEGDLVVLQSTTYPGTTMGPLRTALESDGREAGRDFGLAFSPERVSPGEGRPASTIPRLVGGIDRASTARTAAILQRISPSVIELSSPDAAELAKLFENVFRNVNIALVNELALICERLSLDVWEVIAGASTKPFGFMPFYPGPGVGGHCIPVDPYYLSARAREVGFHERFIETAGDINSRMPDHVVSLVTTALNARGIALARASILVLGVAFKAGVSDDRNSPAAGIIASLQARGADVSYHDPRLPAFDPSQTSSPVQGSPLRSTSFEEALEAKPDCVVIVTPHPEIDWDAVFERADLIVDTRNVSAGRTTRPGQVLRLGAGWS
jgi:UDP-N-acetyl-D-glucosamine dehydrogenase